MNILEIGKRALGTIRQNKALWFFGFFVASSGGSGGGGGGSGAGGEPLPGWVWIVVGLAVCLAIATLILHVLSEAALIEGVHQQRAGKRLGVKDGLREARRHFFRLFAFKLVVFGLALGGVAMLGAPALLGALGVLPLALGIGLSLMLALPGGLALLTLKLLYEYGMRAIVLEERPAMDGWRSARRHLHGHLLDATKLLLLSFVGQLGGNAIAVVALLPGALVGVVGYLLGGWTAALIAGIPVAAALAIPVVGATAGFRSSVWTLGFLEGQEAR